jgi:hypothetical protein
MAKLVAHERQIALAAQAARQQAENLVKCETAVDDGSEGRELRHVGIHLLKSFRSEELIHPEQGRTTRVSETNVLMF